MKRLWGPALIGVGAAFFAALLVGADQVEVRQVDSEQELFRGVPDAAAAALKSLAGSASVDSVERQRSGSVEMYLAAWEVDGRGRDATVSADGVLLESNESVEVSQVPPPVQRAAAEVFGAGGKLQYQKKTLVFYTVRGPRDGREREIIISPAGELTDEGGAAGSETAPVTEAPATLPAPSGRR